MTDESASDGGGCLCCPKRTGQTPAWSLPRKENGKARTSMDEKGVRKSHGHHIPPALVLKSFEEMNQGGSLQEALNLKFAFIEQEHAFFKEAFKSNDYNNLIHYDFCCIYDFYKNYIYKNTGKTLSSDIDFLLNMYCRGSVDMTVEWVLNDIPIKKEEIVSYLIEAIPDKLKEYMK